MRERVVALLCAAAFATGAHALPDDAAVKALLQQRIAQKRAVGLAAVLYEKGTTRIVTAGVARAGGTAIADDTEFEIGSITKAFTSLLLADLALRGTVALDDPVSKYLPGVTLTRDGKSVSLAQLASHTSGLPRMPKNFAPANPADPYADYDGAKLVAYLAGDVLEQTPGIEYNYSNLGAGTLGYALTAQRGGYDKVLRERVLDPLKMADTGVDLSPAQQTRFATGHNEQLTPTRSWKLDAFAGAGGLRSTAADMARFLEAATDPASSPLAAAFKLAETPRVAASGSLRIGLAWHIFGETRTILWHNGQTGGFASMIAFDPVAREGVVVLSNAAIGVDDLALHMIEASIPLSEPPKERVAVKVDPAVYDRLAGRYEMPKLVLTVRRDGDRLLTQATGQDAFEIFPESELEYFVKAFDAQLSFSRDGSGKVTGVVVHQNGRDIPGKRID